MAGNFWRSSHFQQWLMDPQDLSRERHADLTVITEEEYQKLTIFFGGLIQEIVQSPPIKATGQSKQQVAACAIVYFKRFYVRNSLKSVDPLLLAPTCVFLASKVEETGVIPSSKLIAACHTVVKNKYSFAFPQDFPYRINHILECEFYLLEQMDCCLVHYHPYRPLTLLVQDLRGSDKPDGRDHSKDDLLNFAWTIVNDSYRTDIPLLYPPHLVAIAALHLGCMNQSKDYKQWFAELHIDLDKILEISQMLFRLYDLWKNFDEKKEIPALLAKMPKPKTQSPNQQRPSTQTPESSSQNQPTAGGANQQI